MTDNITSQNIDLSSRITPYIHFDWGEVNPYLVHAYDYTGCPTTYQTRQFFNNFATNEDIATKFEADLPHCVRNVTAS